MMGNFFFFLLLGWGILMILWVARGFRNISIFFYFFFRFLLDFHNNNTKFLYLNPISFFFTVIFIMYATFIWLY